ncbi:MAG TPA: CBS domain-containing protein [Candidatus Acidoferrum sp.]|nr:CBS domain-containing protein [Candidatus Acidoferrum sp.]
MSEATRSNAVSERVPTLLDEPIKVLQRRDPVTVAPGTTLAACLQAIQRTGTGDSVVVADTAGRLVGVLTERDMVAQLVGTDEDLERPVEALMNATPHTLHFDSPIRDAVSLMETGLYRNVPIVDDDGLVQGIVRPQDVLRYLAESFPEEVLNLPPRPHQKMKETEGA